MVKPLSVLNAGLIGEACHSDPNVSKLSLRPTVMDNSRRCEGRPRLVNGLIGYERLVFIDLARI